MQTFSYFSRNLLVEQIQRTIFTKRIKPLNGNYYLYFTLPGQNRIFIIVNSFNFFTECYIKYENRNIKDLQIFKGHIKNSIHIEKFANIVDERIESLNLKNNFILGDDKDTFENIDYDFDSLLKK